MADANVDSVQQSQDAQNLDNLTVLQTDGVTSPQPTGGTADATVTTTNPPAPDTPSLYNEVTGTQNNQPNLEAAGTNSLLDTATFTNDGRDGAANESPTVGSGVTFGTEVNTGDSQVQYTVTNEAPVIQGPGTNGTQNTVGGAQGVVAASTEAAPTVDAAPAPTDATIKNTTPAPTLNADGTSPADPTVDPLVTDPTPQEPVAIAKNPDVAVEKAVTAVNGSGPADQLAAEGDTIEYAVTVTNEGNTTLTNVVVTDEMFGSDQIKDSLVILDANGDPVEYSVSADGVLTLTGDMPVGATYTITYTYEISQDEIDANAPILNAVTVAATEDGAENADTNSDETGDTSTGVYYNPDVAVEKAVTAVNGSGPADQLAAEGDTIEYAVTVTNEGNTTLTNVVVTDEMFGSDQIKDSLVILDANGDPVEYSVSADGVLTLTGDMPVGATYTITYTYEISQDEIDANAPILNAVTVAATEDGAENADTNSDETGDTSTGVYYNPDVAVEKAVTAVNGSGPADQLAAEGDTIEYAVTVTNEGNTTLTNVVVTDEMFGSDQIKDSLVILDANGDPVEYSVSADGVLTLTGDMPVGATYTITYTYEISQDEIDANAPILNAVTVAATEDGAENADTNSDETGDTSTGVYYNPDVAVEKAVTAVNGSGPADQLAAEGDTIEYAVTVTNEGNTTLTNVVVTDEMFGSDQIKDSLVILDANGDPVEYSVSADGVLTLTGDMPVGATYTITYTYEISQDEIDANAPILNAVTVAATEDGAENADTNSDETGDTSTGVYYNPDVAVEKAVTAVNGSGPADQLAAEGDTIEYAVTVTNEGNTTLTNVVVTDEMFGSDQIKDSLVILDANGDPVEYSVSADGVLTLTGDMPVGATYTITYTYEISQDEIDANAPILNAVTVAATEDGAENADTNSDETGDTSTGVYYNPDVAVEKAVTAVNGSGPADQLAAEGDTIEYAVTVTNEGNTTLTNVVVTDEMFGSDQIKDSLVILDANGDPVEYSVSADGVLTLTGDMPVGATYTITYTYEISQDEIDANAPILNAVTVAATEDGAENADTNSDETGDTSTGVYYNPDVAVEKAVTAVNGSGPADQLAAEGDTIEYAVTVTNEGNTTLTNVVVTDEMFGSDQIKDSLVILDANGDPVEYSVSADGVLTLTGDMPVGATYTITYTYEISQDEIDANAPILNAVTVAATEDGAENADTNSDETGDTSTGVYYNPDVAVEKAVTAVNGSGPADQLAAEGDTIEYAVTVTNEGNTTLTNVVVTDEMFGSDQIKDSLVILDANGDPVEYSVSADGVLTLTGDMPVGATYTITYTYEISQDEIDANAPILNAVTVAATEDGAENADTNSDETGDTSTLILYSPDLTLIKSAVVTDMGVGGGSDFGGIRSSGTALGGVEGKIDSAGDQVAYTLTASNAGNTTLHNVKVFDAMFNLANDQLASDNDAATTDDAGRQISVTVYNEGGGVAIPQTFVTVESATDGGITSYFVNVPTLGVGQYAKIDYVYVVTDTAINESSQSVATSIFDSASNFHSNEPLNFEVGGKVIGSVIAYTDDDDRVNPYAHSYDASEKQELFVNSDNTGKAIGVGAGVMSGMRSGVAADHDHIRVNDLDQGNTTGFKFSVTNATAVEIAFQAQYGTADSKFNGSIVIHKDGTFDLYHISSAGEREPLSGNQREWLTVEQESGPGGAQNIIHTIAFRPEGESLDFFDFWVVGHESRNNEVQIKVVDIELEKPGVIENRAFASSNEDPYNVSKVDQYASYQINVAAGPDLELIKSAVVTDMGVGGGSDFGGIRSSGTALGGVEGKIDSAGDQVAYTLTASNAGNTTLHNVKVFDAMFNLANDQLASDNDAATTDDAGRQISVTVYNEGGGVAIPQTFVTVESATDGGITSYFVNVPTLGVGQYAKIDYVYVVTATDIDNFNNSSGLYSIENRATATADEDVYSSSKVDQIASYDIELVHGGKSDLEVFKSAVVDSNGDAIADYTFDSSGDLITYTITVINRGEISTEERVKVYDAMFEFAEGDVVLVNGLEEHVQYQDGYWFVEIDPIGAKNTVDLVYDYVVTDHDISGSAKSLISLLDGASPRGPLGYGPFELKGNVGTVLAYQDVDNLRLYDLDFDKTEVRQLYVNTDNTGTAIGVDAGVMAGDRNGYRDHLLLNFNDNAPVTSTSISFTNATAIEVAFKAGYAGTTTTGSVTISNIGAIKEFNAGGSSPIDITNANQLFDLSVMNGPGGAQNRIYTITFQSPDATLDYFDFWVVGSNSAKNFNEVQLKVVDVTLASPSSIENTAMAVIGSELPNAAPEDQVAKYNVDYATGISVSDLFIEINEVGNKFDIAQAPLISGDGSVLKYEIAGGTGSKKQGVWGKLAIDSSGHYSYEANSQTADELGGGDIGVDTFVVNISGNGATSQKIVKVSLVGSDVSAAQTTISISEDDVTYGGVLPTTVSGREYHFTGEGGKLVPSSYKGNFDYFAEGGHGHLYLNSGTGEYQYIFDDQGSYQSLSATNLNEALDSFSVSSNDGVERLIVVNVFGVNDAPVLAGDLTATVLENGSYTITASDLGYTDVDSASTAITFAVSSLTNGNVQVGGVNASSFTAAQLAAGSVTFVHNGSETTSASFAVSVDDANQDGSTPVASTFNLTVTPVNDAPVLAGDLTATVLENGSYTITASDLGYTDVDSASTAITFAVSSLTNGNVQVGGVNASSFTAAQLAAGSVTFVHNGSETTSASFAVSVDDANQDGSTPVASTFNLTVTPVNDAPVLAGDLTATVLENGSYTITASDLGYTDVDSASTAITFAVSSLTNGNVQVGGVNASSFTAAQLAAGSVTFVHNGSETTSASFAVSVDDANQDGSTPVASTFNLTVTPVNDAPVLAGDLTATVLENGSYTITASDLGYTDVDSASTAITFAVSSLTNGNVQVGGVNASSFTAAQLAAGSVTFVHNGSETTSASFAVSVDDANQDGSTPVASTFNLTVTPVNDAPVLAGDLTATVLENGSYTITASDLGYTDVDSASTAITFAVSSLTNGNVQVGGVNASSFTAAQLAAGSVTFVHNGSETTSASFAVSVDDANQDGSTPVASTFNLTVTPVNDAPTISISSINDFTEDAAGNSLSSVVATYTTADAEGSSVTVALSDRTNYVLGTGANAGKVLLTQAGLNLVNAGTDLPAFTLTPNDGTINGTAATVDPSVTPVNSPGVAAITRSGNILTASVTDSDGVSGASYKWYYDGVQNTGVTTSTYTLSSSEQNNTKLIYVVATYTDSKGVETAQSPSYLINKTSATLTQQPIALDLNNDGIHYISRDAGATYDYNHDGIAESTAWVAPEDGLLAIQKEDGTHNIVFSTQAGETDLQGLAKVYDSNKDGILDAKDADFAKFGVWQDADSDGIVDSGEYLTLADRGITSLSLTSDGQVHFEANGDVIVYGQTTYTTADGEIHIAEDVGFAVSDVYEPLDIAAIIANADAIESVTRIDQLAETDSSSSLMVELGGQTYEIATLLGQELGTQDILSQFVGGDTSANLLTNKSWTDVIDIASDHGGPGAIIAAGGTLDEGAYANGEGDWTVVINSGDAKVDATNNQITFSSDSAENSVTITTADGSSHNIDNVDKIQWHG